MRNGSTTVAEVPCPRVMRGCLLVQTERTLISAGTERMLVQFGRSSPLAKARQQPEKVRQVLDKIATDGLVDTLRAVRNKLDTPSPLGYSNAGRVIAIGDAVTGWSVGDRVVSNGAHAEVIVAPQNLCARIPDSVSTEDAAFAVLAAIGLQGIRLAQPTLGETFVVMGLGLIGLLTTQLLIASGCRVIGLDYAQDRLRLAKSYGAEIFDLSAAPDAVGAVIAFSRGRGADGVLLAASTDSSDPVSQAAKMCRKRARIVLVGVTGLELSRADFYEKELSFQVSCSYGPGRYDPEYEQKGRDYPFGFVRWTEQRNFEAVLDMMACGQLVPKALVTHRFPIERAGDAYDAVVGDGAALGVLLEYPTAAESLRTTVEVNPARVPATNAARKVSVGVIGAGNYASQVLVPLLAKSAARLRMISSNGGASAQHVARRFGFEAATTDPEQVIADPSIDTVIVATRHDTHAELAVRALIAGKQVFVEKPLALSHRELDEIEAAVDRRRAQGSPAVLMVGFNRRFAPHVRQLKDALAGRHEPLTAIYTVNAGEIPAAHWTQDQDVGGGRIVGEACHFIDLLRFLVGARIVDCRVTALGADNGSRIRDDKSTITLRFCDGSHATIHYFANGHRSFPKERLEVFSGNSVYVIDNFRRFQVYGGRARNSRLWRQDKGQAHAMRAFLEAVSTGGSPPIPLEETIEVSRVAIEAAAAAVADAGNAPR